MSVSERATLQKHETEHTDSCTQHDYQLSALPTDSFQLPHATKQSQLSRDTPTFSFPSSPTNISGKPL